MSELAVVQFGIKALLRQKFFVRALLHNLSVLHDQDGGGGPNGGKAMGHDKGGSAFHHFGKGVLELKKEPLICFWYRLCLWGLKKSGYV